MKVHQRDPGRGDEPKRPIEFRSPLTEELPTMMAIDQVRDLHIASHKKVPTKVYIGMDMVAGLLADLAKLWRDPNLTLDDIPGASVYDMVIAFDFTMNGIKVE